MTSDDRGVRSGPAKAVVDRLEHAVGISARLVLGRAGQDRNVDRPRTGCIDLVSDTHLVRRADRQLRARIDVEGLRAQRQNGCVDPRPSLSRGHEHEPDRKRE